MVTGALLDAVPAGADPATVATWLRGGAGLVGWGEGWRGTVRPGAGRFARAAADAAAALAGTDPPDRAVAFAAFTFDPDAQGSTLLIPRTVCRGTDNLAAVPTPHRQSRVRYAGASLDEVAWLDAVARAIKEVRGGSLQKVVLARDVHVWSEQPLQPLALARRLAAAQPDSWTFCLDGLVGATPELLLRRRGRAVTSLVLAGTAARGRDSGEDVRLGEGLLTSDKDREEHAHSVASVREGFAAFASDVTTDPAPHLLRLPHVQHLATWVRGTLESTASALELAGSLHPTAAICGTPTTQARALIGELERLDRARYTGPVGWVDAQGDGEFGIALRCAEVAGTRARIFAGVGIVAGSLPEAELEETRLKLLAMRAALES